MSTPEILTSVTTPLALAALCLLGGSGILKVVARQRPSASLRLAIHWGFILALVLGVLANLSYIVIASFGREIRIAGSVRDDADRPLSRAIVDIPGRGRGISDDYGAFELTIPDSRKADTYEGIVTLDGFGSQKFSLQGPIPKQTVSVSLKRPRLEPTDLIPPPEMVNVGHYLGMPVVNLKLHFFNPMPSHIHLENISCSVIDPDGKEHQLPMLGTYAPSGQFLPTPLPILDLERSQNWTLGYKFGLFDSGFNALMLDAQQEYGQNMPLPTIGQTIFSSTLAERFRQFMMKTMIWRAGNWRLVIRATVDNKELFREFSFNLTQEGIEGMRSVSKYYRTGYSTLPIFPDAPDGKSHISVIIH